jgi:cysteinyl-tRNA synthetase
VPIKIYNTMTRRKEDFVPIDRNEVRIYVCGVTVYDLSHIGHARSALVFDMIRRYLRFRGYGTRFVRNYTDVDDKIIRRATAEGVSPREISERFIEAERADMASLGLLPPDVEPRATDHIPQMIELIEGLIRKGLAYTMDGDVYFEVRRYPPYGRLSGKNLDDLLAGARVEVDERKRDPRDFALWKSQAGRAVLGQPVGGGTAGLAHRVLGHGHEAPG